MTKYVREIMNPELFSVTIDAKAADTLDTILELGITAVPVLDDSGRPIGVTSIRDILRGERGSSHVSRPALAIAMNASIDDAAKTMIDSDTHHLVVVGSDGCAVGMVSSLDLLRALTGEPMKYPAAFPHRDEELEVTWTDRHFFTEAEILKFAPKAPGVLVLSIGRERLPDYDIWTESAAPSLQRRLLDLVRAQAAIRSTKSEAGRLEEMLHRPGLQFRCARVLDAQSRDKVARRLRDRIEHSLVISDQPLVP